MIYRIYNVSKKFNRDSINVDWVMPQDYHVDAPYSYNKSHQGAPLTEVHRLPHMKVVKGASLTDYLGVAGIDSFMIVSEMFIGSLINLKVPPIKSLEINILDGEKTIIYHGIHFESDLSDEFINWGESEFHVKKGYYGEIVDVGITLSSFREYIEMRKKVSVESGRKLTLGHNKFAINDISNHCDLFYSSLPSPGIFCSEKLLELIINHEFSGFNVKNVTRR